MNLNKYKWNLNENNYVLKIPDFFKEEHISDELAKIIMKRGVQSKEDLNSFVNGTLKNLANPFLMKGMEEAVSRILYAIDNNESIVIYGDYDVDGITSTSILYRFFKNLGVNIGYYIPDREMEGYGPNINAINKLSDKYDLLITVDCGIAAADIFDKSVKNIDIIVTDHHMPPDILPDVVAVIDPHQKDCRYPFNEMAGCGVAYSLCRAISLKKFNKDYFEDLELVALGTIADVVSLTSENRILVKEGLKKLVKTDNKGLKALLFETGVLKPDIALNEQVVKADRISFILAPRLNAAGRIKHAKLGVELLTSINDDVAKELAIQLCEINSERQKIEREIYENAKEVLNKIDLKNKKSIVVFGENWHPGVIGIVASRLLDTYNKPSFVITIKDGIGKGSCRSIPGFNIYEALKANSDILIQFGGHKMAAGFSIKKENIKLFEKKINDYANSKITDEDCMPIINIDQTILLSEVNLDFVKSLEVLEPFGCDNPKPIFVSKNVFVNTTRRIGVDNKHLKFTLSNDIECIYWNCTDKNTCTSGQVIDVVYEMEIHDWYGEHVQLNCKDIRFSSKYKLNRDILVDIYSDLRKSNILKLNKENLIEYVYRNLNNVYDKTIIELAISVFVELGILSILKKNGEIFYSFNIINKKFNLENSKIYKKYSND